MPMWAERIKMQFGPRVRPELEGGPPITGDFFLALQGGDGVGYALTGL